MMKHFAAALFLCLIALGSMDLRAETPKSPDVSRELTSDEARADFDLMRSALEEAHAGLYRYSTKAEMDRAFDAQRAKLDRPMRKTQFMVVLSETIAAIRCGHTGVQP